MIICTYIHSNIHIYIYPFISYLLLTASWRPLMIICSATVDVGLRPRTHVLSPEHVGNHSGQYVMGNMYYMITLQGLI